MSARPTEYRCHLLRADGARCQAVLGELRGGCLVYHVAPIRSTLWGIQVFHCPGCGQECAWTPPHVRRHLREQEAG